MNFDKAPKKKIISFIGIGIIIFLLILGSIDGRKNKDNGENGFTLLEKVKFDEIPNYMKTEPKTKKDKEKANILLKKLEDKYNTEFTLIGVAYYEVELNVDEVAAIYAYSKDYPNVYISNDFFSDDRYLEKVEGWKIKNMVYDKAYDMGIDVNYLGVLSFLQELNSDNVSFEIMVNKQLSMSEIERLLQQIYSDLNTESLNVTLYHTDDGTNSEFKKFMNGLTITETWIELEFGSWSKYNILVNSEGISVEHKYTHTK